MFYGAYGTEEDAKLAKLSWEPQTPCHKESERRKDQGSDL